MPGYQFFSVTVRHPAKGRAGEVSHNAEAPFDATHERLFTPVYQLFLQHLVTHGIPVSGTTACPGGNCSVNGRFADDIFQVKGIRLVHDDGKWLLDTSPL